MAEYFFDLSQEDRREALEYAREQTGRPAHLLEKDALLEACADLEKKANSVTVVKPDGTRHE